MRHLNKKTCITVKLSGIVLVAIVHIVNHLYELRNVKGHIFLNKYYIQMRMQSAIYCTIQKDIMQLPIHYAIEYCNLQ